MILIIIVALGFSFVGSAPTQAAVAAQRCSRPQQPQNPSPRYRLVTLRMTKEKVRRLMGKPSHSTDTLWLYT